MSPDNTTFPGSESPLLLFISQKAINVLFYHILKGESKDIISRAAQKEQQLFR